MRQQGNKPDDNWVVAHEPRITIANPERTPILELGCAEGRDTFHLSKLGPVVALDLRFSSIRENQTTIASAAYVQADLQRGLPFGDRTFPVIVASLCLHYFDWATSEYLSRELARCLVPGGLVLVRVNSTNDTNYGAGKGHALEPNFYQLGDRTKRFFDENALHTLFADWRIESATERRIERYHKPKWVWEAVLYADDK